MSKKYFWEEKIEHILWWSRFLVLISVFVWLIMFLFLNLSLFFKLYHLIINFVQEWFTINLLAWVISILDVSLLSVIILIFTWWIYELFVSEIDIKSFNSKTLIIKDLDELKEKIWKVIIILLIVILFKQMILHLPDTQTEIIYFALAILMMAWALKIVSIKSKK